MQGVVREAQEGLRTISKDKVKYQALLTDLLVRIRVRVWVRNTFVDRPPGAPFWLGLG